MEIRSGVMVHLGYGKFWRSDEILGLSPIEDDRGPGRRTEVYVSTLEDPIVASRSEQSILRDIAQLPQGAFHTQEARSLLGDLLDDLSELQPVIRRMLGNEGTFDVDAWEARIHDLIDPPVDSSTEPDQEDLFRSPH